MKDGQEGYPIGLGTELAQEEIRVPAIPVDNEVVEVNEDMELPFDLKVGEPTDLALFMSPKKGEEGEAHLEVHFHHNRSSLLGRVVFRDKEGRLYRDVDIKGNGYLESRIYYEPRSISVAPLKDADSPDDDMRWADSGLSVWGLMSAGDAEYDLSMSEKFLRDGLRTYRIIAIVKLKELIDKEGKKVSIDEAYKRQILRSRMEPVLEIRAYATKMRVVNAENDKYVRDAMSLVAQELGREPEEFSKKDYLEWFFETLGEQMALMHNAGYAHGFISRHNITLDCKIIDLDSVTDEGSSWKNPEDRDVSRAISDIVPYMCNKIDAGINIEEGEKMLIDSYESHLKEPESEEAA